MNSLNAIIENEYLLLKLIQFLWFNEIDNLYRSTSSFNLKIEKLYDMIAKDKILLVLEKQGRISRVVSINNQVKLIPVNDKLSSHKLRCVPSWPSNLFQDYFLISGNTGIIKDEREGVFRYFGNVLGLNRSIKANNPFPVSICAACTPVYNCRFREKIYEGSSIHSSCLPFVKLLSNTVSYIKPNIYVDKQCQQQLIYSLVSYFEITIDCTDSTSSSNRRGNSQFHPCVAIGLALPTFPLDKMPGWDSYSFGYHGDDGLFFHNGNPISKYAVHPKIPNTKFGAGDTVGCGFIYPPIGESGHGSIFFTKNGEIAYEMSLSGNNGYIFGYPWFPCVGIDGYYSFKANFGTYNYVFDIMTFENSLLITKFPQMNTETFRKNGLLPSNEIYNHQYCSGSKYLDTYNNLRKYCMNESIHAFSNHEFVLDTKKILRYHENFNDYCRLHFDDYESSEYFDDDEDSYSDYNDDEDYETSDNEVDDNFYISNNGDVDENYFYRINESSEINDNDDNSNI